MASRAFYEPPSPFSRDSDDKAVYLRARGASAPLAGAAQGADGGLPTARRQGRP